MIRKILKVVGWIVAGTLGLVVAVYLVAVAINWRDRSPSADAIDLENLYRRSPVVADDENAFIYVMGFNVEPQGNPYQMGLKRVTWLRESKRLGSLDASRDPLRERSDYRAKRLPAVTEFLDACKVGNPRCLGAFRSADGVLGQWMASEGWLRQRYEELIAHRDWRESALFDVSEPLPAYGLVMDGQKLLLLNSKALAERGDYVSARSLLEKDLTFWRKVLESSDILITKMIATAAITRHFELGNLVLRQIPPEKLKDALPTGWTQPISESERSMLRCLSGEWMFMSHAMQNMDVDLYVLKADSTVSRAASWLMMPLYRPQDFKNKNATYLLEMARLLDAPLDRYEEAVNQTAALAQRTRDQAVPPRSPYNVVGQLLIGVGAYDFGTYARRVADLEGVRRAALLAVTLRAANVTAPAISSALSTSALREPYQNRPFEWDQQKGDIIFRGLELDERSVHRIYY